MNDKVQSKDRNLNLSVEKRVKRSCDLLSKSDKTMEDIYNIVFSAEGVLCETSGTAGLIYYTYSDFRNEVRRVASFLMGEIGTGKFVGLYGTNSFEWTVAFWAILRSGNKPYLININQPESAIKSVLSNLECKHIVCTEKAPSLCDNEILYTSIPKDVSEKEFCSFGNAVALTTSSTTLREKICIYTGDVICNQLLIAPYITKETPRIQDTYNGKIKMLMVLPLYHIFGLEASYLWFLILGAVFVFPPSLAPSVLLSAVKRHEVTHIFAVPLFWQNIEKNINREVSAFDEKTKAKFSKAKETSLKLQDKSVSLGEAFAKKAFAVVRNKLFGDSVRFCISGGADISTETLSLINALGYPLYNGYGMTEIGIVSANFAQSIKRRLNHTIGKMFATIEADISSDGHLLISGKSICREMIVDGEKISLDGWFDTGDIVEKTEFGDFDILGRASDIVINDDGENLNPNMAEKAFSLSKALNFSVLGDTANKSLVLIVQIPKDMLANEIQTLKSEVDDGILKLPKSYNIKKVYFTADSLMDEKEIKISRKRLSKRIEKGDIHFINIEEPSEVKETFDTEIGSKLKEIFSSVLGMKKEDVDASAHFMNDLGGTSLDYYDVICKIETVFGVKLDMEEKNFAYSLADFESLIKEKKGL